MYNVLIVEDEPISAHYLKKILRQNGIAVCGIEESTHGALEAIKRCKPDLILLDIILVGNQSGCELALDIRRFDNDVIIIFLSAHANESMLDYALNVNAYSYLLKPYRDQEILSTVKMALQQHKKKTLSHIVTLKNGYGFDTQKMRLLKYGTDTLIHGKQLELIALLAQKRATSVSFEEIANRLYNDDASRNTIRSLVHRIKTNAPDLEIHNVSKVGYVLY